MDVVGGGLGLHELRELRVYHYVKDAGGHYYRPSGSGSLHGYVQRLMDSPAPPAQRRKSSKKHDFAFFELEDEDEEATIRLTCVDFDGELDAFIANELEERLDPI